MTTWNPSDKTAGTTLSNGNLTATFAGTGNGVRSVPGVSAGKWYWEVRFNTGPGPPGVGVANASATLGTVWSTPTNAAVAYNGSTYVNNVLHGGGSSGISIIPAKTIAIAWDAGVQRLWFRNVTDGGNWNNNSSNNPATNVGGIDIAVLGSSLFALACGGSADWIANFGATAFAGAVPSGFSAWDLPVLGGQTAVTINTG